MSADVIVSWSGGKDCTLAAYRAIQEGKKVKYLASIIIQENGRLWPHMLSPEVLRYQARAMGIPLLERVTTVKNYDDNYRRMLGEVKAQGVTGIVFGDVQIGNNLSDKHLSWVRSVCEPIGMDYYLPLWPHNREELLSELIELGFEVNLIAVDNTDLGPEWLGRKLDKDMLAELKLRHSLSPDGSVGYYHTFVTDGPTFKSKLVIEEWDRILDDQAKIGGMGVWYMDIKRCALESKNRVEATV